MEKLISFTMLKKICRDTVVDVLNYDVCSCLGDWQEDEFVKCCEKNCPVWKKLRRCKCS